MRRFCSYGPLDTEEHFYAPRTELIQRACTQLVGTNPQKSGHYMTVWAPRQTGKTWLMQQILFQLQKDDRFDVIKINLETLRDKTEVPEILSRILLYLGEKLGKSFPKVHDQLTFQDIFRKGTLDKPLILILDEFDSMSEGAITALVSTFRNIYIDRLDEKNKPTGNKSYLLHSAALIGIRSVVGVENVKGSPFNIQRSLHIPNLTLEEVKGMFQWYQDEIGQKIDDQVIERIFYETRGQPGLTCWFGELLTEGYEEYRVDQSKVIGMREFDKVFDAAVFDLPNSNLVNIISKAKESPYKDLVLEVFRTESKLDFKFDDPQTNFLFMHGVIDREIVNSGRRYIRFSCPFVQKRLFNHFSTELSRYVGKLYDSMEKLEDVITEEGIDVRSLLDLYRNYLSKNSKWLFENAPRRADLRIREAVFHFTLYAYLNEFLKGFGGKVYPEFPTGNGKVDLLIYYKGIRYAIEVKSFNHLHQYRESLKQAAKYGRELGLKEIFLVFFIDKMDDENRKKHEIPFQSEATKVTVAPVFVETDIYL
jgi:hypothetical protein